MPLIFKTGPSYHILMKPNWGGSSLAPLDTQEVNLAIEQLSDSPGLLMFNHPDEVTVTLTIKDPGSTEY